LNSLADLLISGSGECLQQILMPFGGDGRIIFGHQGSGRNFCEFPPDCGKVIYTLGNCFSNSESREK